MVCGQLQRIEPKRQRTFPLPCTIPLNSYTTSEVSPHSWECWRLAGNTSDRYKTAGETPALQGRQPMIYDVRLKQDLHVPEGFFCPPPPTPLCEDLWLHLILRSVLVWSLLMNLENHSAQFSDANPCRDLKWLGLLRGNGYIRRRQLLPALPHGLRCHLQ